MSKLNEIVDQYRKDIRLATENMHLNEDLHPNAAETSINVMALATVNTRDAIKHLFLELVDSLHHNDTNTDELREKIKEL